MSYYHLTWDAKTSKHTKIPEDLTELLCGDPFCIRWICRPVESTLVFWKSSAKGDVDRMHDAILAKYKEGFDFVITRVAESRNESGDSHHLIRGRGVKDHEDGYEKVLSELKSAGRIDNSVKTLRKYVC